LPTYVVLTPDAGPAFTANGSAPRPN